ncbi:MAG TPA: tetratricopeptide repeat protein [Opitutaceae bacterium]|nr:tetratricopeptide repeat protein [Opitutaceae bacterium]
MKNPAKAPAAIQVSTPVPVLAAFRLQAFLLGCGLVLAVLAAYGNSFSCTFVLDDTTSILGNRTIQHLWTGLSPPVHAGVGGRPLLNFSYALNYAMDGTAVQGYHLFNIIIHALAGLTLFGLVRRTLLRPVLPARLREAAMPLAFVVASLWMLHPLQTESVTYISQRAESLMALWYLLTLYCFARGAESSASRSWFVLALTACLLGMATKEVMASAPLMVMLYDRTFFAGSFSQAWRRRWRFYLGLASSWILLGCLMTGLHDRGVGFDRGVSWWAYAMTECWVIVQYLELTVWPHPLVFDYGPEVMKHAGEAIPYVLVLAGLATATLVGLWRWPVPGFVGGWVFVILAPTSSVVPVNGQPMAENRMYLPLAAVIALIVLGLYSLAGRRILPLLLGSAIGLGFLTGRRNMDYQSRMSIWSDTVAKCPGNARGHDSLGNALDDNGRTEEALQEYKKAVDLAPNDPREHYNLGRALEKLGQMTEALAQYQEALRRNPNYAEAHNNLGVVLAHLGQTDEAIGHCRTAIKLEPDDPSTHYNLGMVFLRADRLPEAVAQFEEALRLNPDYSQAHDSLGIALAKTGQVAAAISQYDEALRLNADDVEAHYNLGVVLLQAGRIAEAIGQYQAALRIKPSYADAHLNLGDAYVQVDRLSDALSEYEDALRFEPNDPVSHTHVGIVLFQMGRAMEAAEHFQRAQILKSDYAPAYYWQGNVLTQAGQLGEAVQQLEKAVQLEPDFAEAHNNLGMTLLQLGQIPEAIAHLKEAVRLQPNYTRAINNLAQARAAQEAQDSGDQK